MIYLKNFFLNQNIFNIVAFGFLIRALTLIFYGNPLFGDTETHRLIGTEILIEIGRSQKILTLRKFLLRPVL